MQITDLPLQNGTVNRALIYICHLLGFSWFWDQIFFFGPLAMGFLNVAAPVCKKEIFFL
jgi:hypothetical protein